MAKILLVDDDKLMVKMYQGKFADDGYEIDVALNGKEGLAKTLNFKPDLILLDIMMPEVNGLEMLERLKEKEETKRIPVILLTNVGGDDDAKKGLAMGAVAYLVKAHYDAKDVVKKVKEILGGYGRELPKVEVEVSTGAENKMKKAQEKVDKAKEELEAVKKKTEEVEIKPERAS